MSSQGVMPFGSKDRGEAGELLIKVVSMVLEELIAAPTQSWEAERTPISKFHGLRAPSIAISDYLARISKFSGCSDECFVLALIYIDRLITKRKIVLDQLNVHRLVVTSVMLAAKFFDDHYLDNQHYAAVGGVQKGEMNTLELEFLFLLEFQLHVTRADYDMYRTALYAKFDGSAHPRQFPEDPYNEEIPAKKQMITSQNPRPTAGNSQGLQQTIPVSQQQFVQRPAPQFQPAPAVAYPNAMQYPSNPPSAYTTPQYAQHQQHMAYPHLHPQQPVQNHQMKQQVQTQYYAPYSDHRQ